MSRFFFVIGCLIATVTLSSSVSDKKEMNELPKTVRSNYALVPAGMVSVGGDSMALTHFYLMKTEVDNLSYREFLGDLKKNGKQNDYLIANVDSTIWRTEMAYCEAYVTHYFSHPAYNKFPVVNVSYEGAQLYCKWLSEKFNQLYSHEFTYEVRLPSRIEWLYAAESAMRKTPYTWGGPFLRNSRGCELCNYKCVGDEKISNDTVTLNASVIYTAGLDGADVTAPVESYFPNLLGFYNMNGNVAEMVSEKGMAVGGSWNSTGYDVRNESIMNYTQASPLVGFRTLLIVKRK